MPNAPVSPVTVALVGALVGSAITVVSTWLLMMVSPFLTHRLMLWLRGPKLTLRIVADETSTNAVGINQLYVSVRVTNVKPRIAKQCRGYLLRIEETHGRKVVKTIFDHAVQCIWEFDGQRDGFDIPMGASPGFNVVMYQMICFTDSETFPGGSLLGLGSSCQGQGWLS